MAVMSNFGKVSVGVGKTLQVVDGQKYVTLQAEYDAYKISSQAAFDASMSELRESKDASIAAIQGDYDELNSQYSALSNQYDVLDASYQEIKNNYDVIDASLSDTTSELNEYIFLSKIGRFNNIRAGVYPNGHKQNNTLDTYKVPREIILIQGNAFQNSSLKTIIFNEELESLANSAFQQAAELETVIFHPNNRITKLPDQAFSSCTSLKNITLPNNLTTIGNYCFYSTAIKSIVIPANVTSIGQWVFVRCRDLQYIIMEPIVPPSLGSKLHDNATTIRYIYVPDESVDAYKSATNWNAHQDNIYPMSEFTPD